MMLYKGYEMVVGLEVHVELKTQTKIFCNCKTTFGAPPNTHICPVCLGMPGALPVLNRRVVEYAVKAGLALSCDIARRSHMDRKNYFYPDLPKGYQISQYDEPLCTGGYVDIETADGQKRIGITRIHIEEDAGKLIHEGDGTAIDCNRCGVPLIEIVSEPDMRSAVEAAAYLRQLRTILRYAGVSDCRMNEGAMRCDVNLSVRRPGEALGTRTEMKNINSFQFVQKAIEYEYRRQVDVLERGESIDQETRRFDPSDGKTYLLRQKENADDYRYFPEPDIPPFAITDDEIQSLAEALPMLPEARKAMYRERFGLTANDCSLIIEEPCIADYFEKCAAETAYPKLCANLLITDALRHWKPETDTFPFAPCRLSEVATLLGKERINSSVAKKLIERLLEEDFDPESYVKENHLEQINDVALLEALVCEMLAKETKTVDSYRKGKTAALQALVGKAMGQTGGRANPVVLRELMEKHLLEE